MSQELPYELVFDNMSLDAYVEETAKKHGLNAGGDLEHNRVYRVDDGKGYGEKGLDFKVMFLHVSGEPDSWEARIGQEVISDEDLNVVLKKVVEAHKKSAKAAKRKVTFTVTLELDADQPDDQKHDKLASTTLAELVVKAAKKLAPTGTKVKKVTVNGVKKSAAPKAKPKS